MLLCFLVQRISAAVFVGTKILAENGNAVCRPEIRRTPTYDDSVFAIKYGERLLLYSARGIRFRIDARTNDDLRKTAIARGVNIR